MMKHFKHQHIQAGFTLVEMAIVLAIIALVLGASLTVLSVQQDQRRIDDTNTLLSNAQEALLGFALANGRLPCPASSTSNGFEDPNTGGACTHPYDGFLPAATLSFKPVDNLGYSIDAWSTRIRYAVTTDHTNAATTVDGIKSTTMGTFAPDLYVCDSAAGITATTCGTAIKLTSKAVAVIYSLGKNSSTAGNGIDEAANLNNNQVFVSHSIAFAKDNPTNGEFDDQVIWLSPYILFNRMVQAGKLP